MSPRSVVIVTLYRASTLMLMGGGLAMAGSLRGRGLNPESLELLTRRSTGLVEDALHLVVEGPGGDEHQVALEVDDGRLRIVPAPQLNHAPEEMGVGIGVVGGDGGVEPDQGPVRQLRRGLRIGVARLGGEERHPAGVGIGFGVLGVEFGRGDVFLDRVRRLAILYEVPGVYESGAGY